MHNCYGKAIKKFQIDKMQNILIRSFEWVDKFCMSVNEIKKVKEDIQKNLELLKE